MKISWVERDGGGLIEYFVSEKYFEFVSVPEFRDMKRRQLLGATTTSVVVLTAGCLDSVPVLGDDVGVLDSGDLPGGQWEIAETEDMDGAEAQVSYQWTGDDFSEVSSGVYQFDSEEDAVEEFEEFVEGIDTMADEAGDDEDIEVIGDIGVGDESAAMIERMQDDFEIFAVLRIGSMIGEVDLLAPREASDDLSLEATEDQVVSLLEAKDQTLF